MFQNTTRKLRLCCTVVLWGKINILIIIQSGCLFVYVWALSEVCDSLSGVSTGRPNLSSRGTCVSYAKHATAGGGGGVVNVRIDLCALGMSGVCVCLQPPAHKSIPKTL